MKSILYAGATLMIGACIYGFVDYSKTRNKKEFKNMYSDQEVITPAAEKQTPAVNTAKIETPVDHKKAAEDDAVVSNTNTRQKTIAKVVKKRNRTFNTRLFSRGALDERFIKEDKIKTEEPKTTTVPVIIGTGKPVQKESHGENKEQ
jgi:hypothetical protein